MTKKRLYPCLFVICMAGYAWLMILTLSDRVFLWGCLFRRITGLPCPACGSTRSVLSVLHGDCGQAWRFNPFGFIIAALMLVVPVWILADWLRRTDRFFRAYQRMESLLKRKAVYIPAIALVLCNWIWNFFKYG